MPVILRIMDRRGNTIPHSFDTEGRALLRRASCVPGRPGGGRGGGKRACPAELVLYFGARGSRHERMHHLK